MHAGQDTARGQAAAGHTSVIRTITQLIIDSIRQQIAASRSRRELAALDAHMLKDIGLHLDDDGHWQIDRAGMDPLHRHRTPKR